MTFIRSEHTVSTQTCHKFTQSQSQQFQQASTGHPLNSASAITQEQLIQPELRNDSTRLCMTFDYWFVKSGASQCSVGLHLDQPEEDSINIFLQFLQGKLFVPLINRLFEVYCSYAFVIQKFHPRLRKIFAFSNGQRLMSLQLEACIEIFAIYHSTINVIINNENKSYGRAL